MIVFALVFIGVDVCVGIGVIVCATFVWWKWKKVALVFFENTTGARNKCIAYPDLGHIAQNELQP